MPMAVILETRPSRQKATEPPPNTGDGDGAVMQLPDAFCARRVPNC